MNTFEITIQRKSGDNWPVVVEHSQSGAFLPTRSEGLLYLGLGELKKQTTPLTYGTVLGKALFQDEVRDAFVRARATGENALRVLLVVEDPELKLLRWERLCAPIRLGGQWAFLARDQRTFFSLYLPSRTDRLFRPIGSRDLRALILVADPENLAEYSLEHFDVHQTVSSLRATLGEIPSEVLATVTDAVGPPTLDELCRRITAEQYTLLHIVAHGWFRRDDGETILYLADTDNQVAPVAATRLLERLDQLEGAKGLPHFVFLATCESASAEAEGALGGLAQRLVRDLGMPVVLAMTEKVSIATAEVLAKEFYLRLREHGEPDRALVEACVGLADRYDITVPALYSRLGGRPLFSDTADRPLTNKEIEFGLSQLDEILPNRAPVLEKTFNDSTTILRKSLDTDPEALSEAARQERRGALTQLNTICDEALDLSFNALSLGQEPPGYDERCPFQGLYPFHEQDREFFFGRKSLMQTLQQKLEQDRFLAVLGPSGSGKSSVVLAGLIPSLQEENSDLRMVYLTPGSDPLNQLETSLAEVDKEAAVLVVDQFEELFTLCSDETKRQAFLDRLLSLPEHLPVAITMRADFWGECAPYPELREQMQARQELIAPMDTAELRRAMEQQARTVGLRFEADLSHTILEDVQDEPGAMPLLQHALQELWKRRHGQWLRTGEYRAIGGVRKAIAETADVFYKRVSPEEQKRVRDIFVRLTRLDEEAVKREERRDTRRRVWLKELVPAESDQAATKDLVRRLADIRLVVTSVNLATKREEVEVAHEALIRYWPRLRGWLDEDRASLQLRERISEAAREWEDGKREESLLIHRGSRLEEAEILARTPKFPLSKLEQAYVNACVTLRERERAEKEEQQRRELEAARKLAEEAQARQAAEEEARREAEHRAEEQAKSTNRLRQRAFALVVVVILALGAAVFALMQQQKAQENEERANIRAEEAKQAQDEAEKRREEAEEAKAEVERQLFVSIARDLIREAPRQQNQGKQDELGALLARQAYLFNHRARGHVLDQVDETLRTVLKARYFSPILHGHESKVSAVAFSPDGQTLASGSEDNTVRLWDLRRPAAEPTVLHGHESDVLAVAFSPDGQTLASGSGDATVRLWDLRHPAAEPTILRSHEGYVFAVAFSSDGQTLASGSWDATVRLWDLRRPAAEPTVLRGHDDRVWAVAFSPDGQTLASGSRDATVRLWDWRLPEAAPTVLRGHEGYVLAVAFSPDGQTLASSSRDRTVRLWDLRRPAAEPTVLRDHDDQVYAVAFSPDGQTLVSGSGDATVRLWDLSSPETKPIVLLGHKGWVYAVAFSPDGQTLASGSEDATVRLWDLGSSEAKPIVLRGQTINVNAVAFSPDGQTLASGSLDRAVRLWDLRRPEAAPTALRDHDDTVWAVAFSPDGQTLASGSRDTTVRLWDLRRPEATPTVLRGHDDRVSTVAFSPDGQTLASGSWDAAVRLWDLRRLEVAPTVLRGHEGSGSVLEVAFSPDGQTLASGSEDATVQLWNLGSLDTAPIVLRGHDGAVLAVAFNPDGQTLASGSEDATVRLWDLGHPEAVPTVLRGHEERVSAVAFNSDDQTLASGSGDATVRLWDLGHPEVDPTVLRGQEEGVHAVAFSPDDQTLASGSRDATIFLWIARTEALADIVCQKVWRNLMLEEWRQSVGEGIPYELTCPNLPLHPSFLEVGRDLAKEGGIDGAVAIFQRALALDPALDLDPQVEANKWAASALIAKGKKLAKEGDVEGVVTFFEKALELDPSLDLDPKAEANKWVASALIEKGKKLAKEGDVEGVVTFFEKALELDPSLDLDPKTEAGQLAASGLVEKGQELVKQGKVKETLESYTKAQTLDPTLKISAQSWGMLCFYGSLWGYGAEVIDACERGFALNPEDEDTQVGIRLGRGIARAQIGNYDEALEDLQAVIPFIESYEEGKGGEFLQKLFTFISGGIKTLQAGENPFTPELLEKLRNE
ncbi:MAG: CHAT domain-containing protein [bacterium]|nr:CHAT domain-containing protein [bacterium]